MSKKLSYDEQNEILIEKMLKNLGQALENASSSCIPEYTQKNVKYRASAGLKGTIIREELSNCCKWCHDLAGEYEYGKEPSNVYARHDNCKCIVLFKSEKGKYHDVWSKKEYDTYEEAVNSAKLHEYEKSKRIAKNKGESCVDAKLKWESYKITDPTVGDLNYAEVDGVKYIDGINNAKVVLDYSIKEKITADIISKSLGVNIKMVPRVLYPQYKRTPDYLINGLRFDRKELKGSSHNTVAGAVKSLKREGRIQAENMVLVITENSLNRQEVLYYLKQAYASKHYMYLNTTIVMEKEEIIAIFERI